MFKCLEVSIGSPAQSSIANSMSSSCLGSLVMYLWVMCKFKCICPQQRTLVTRKPISALFSDVEFLQQILNVRDENKFFLFHSDSSLLLYDTVKW